MAETRIIDNATRPAGDELLDSLAWASDVRIATAFAKRSGIARVREALVRLLSKGGAVRVVYGLDFHITDPEAIEQFIEIAEAYPGATHYAYSDWRLSLSHTFHPKLYICTDISGKAHVITGSSNLTYAGLSENIEVNAVVTGDVSECVIVDALRAFDRIAEKPTLFVPNTEYVERYREMCHKARSFPLAQRPPAKLASAYREIKQAEAQLRPRVLSGGVWTADVLSCVRELQQEKAEFNLDEFMERFGRRLEVLHPKNRFVRDKVRQQLQLLRHRNVVAFLDNRGRYRVIDEESSVAI